MKWFDKWLSKKCKQAWDDSQNQAMESEPGVNINKGGLASAKRRGISIDEGSMLRSNGTNFTLYSANGGTVVELRSYDHVMDRNHNVLYVIPSDKDLGEQLGHIVTMEALKR
jgi:hypothetical protein